MSLNALTVAQLEGLDLQTAQLVVEIKNNVKLSQTLGACAFAICLWDTLAYLHIEYRVVWQAKWSPLKIAYLVTRYIANVTGVMYFIGFFGKLLGLLALSKAIQCPGSRRSKVSKWKFCDNYVKVFPAMGTLPLLGCTLILIARAYKLWDGNKALLSFLLFLAFAQEVGMLVISLTETEAVPVGNGVHACVPTSKSDLFILYWIFPAITHSFITIFTFVKAWELTRVTASGATTASRLWMVIFSRYGQIFPICMVVVELVEVVFYLVASQMQRAILSPLSGFLITVLACQMVLILRLTSSGAQAGLMTHMGHSAGSNSGQGHSQIANMGKLGGVQAFVTSHQAVDDEKDYASGTQISVTTAAIHHYRDSRHSLSGQTHIVVPLQKGTGTPPFRAPGDRIKHDKEGSSDGESILDEEEIKPVPARTKSDAEVQRVLDRMEF